MSLFLRDSRRVFGAKRREVLAYRSNEFRRDKKFLRLDFVIVSGFRNFAEELG